MIGGILTVIGSAIGGFFKMRESQASIVETSIRTLGDANASAAQREQAIAQVITAEAGGSKLAANWRPMVMIIFVGLILLYFFGYAPDNLLEPIPESSALGQIFELVTIGLMGYMPLRTVEKIATQINIGKIINEFVKRNV